jgi:hypothetical protein
MAPARTISTETSITIKVGINKYRPIFSPPGFNATARRFNYSNSGRRLPSLPVYFLHPDIATPIPLVPS